MNNSCELFWLICEAMGNAMIDLLILNGGDNNEEEATDDDMHDNDDRYKSK